MLRRYALPAWLRGRPGRSDEAFYVACTAHGAHVLEPGLVLLRGAVCTAEQRSLAAACWAAGCGRANPEHSFFSADGALNGPKARRGRVFDACEHFTGGLGARLMAGCDGWVREARATDAAMPQHTPTHLLMLYYRSGGTLGFHRDEQANDGTGDEPVVSLTLGASADLALRHEHTDPARVLTLHSGDVLLFGGPCRRMLHAVAATHGVADGVLPEAAGAGARLSLTLRHAPEVCGHEHLYRTFRPETDDVRRAPTGDERLLGEEEARRRLRRMVE